MRRLCRTKSPSCRQGSIDQCDRARPDGDNPDADIPAARRAGIPSVLVLTGVADATLAEGLALGEEIKAIALVTDAIGDLPATPGDIPIVLGDEYFHGTSIVTKLRLKPP